MQGNHSADIWMKKKKQRLFLERGQILRGILLSKFLPVCTKDSTGKLGALHPKSREEVSVSKWNNYKSTVAFPSVHMMI